MSSIETILKEFAPGADAGLVKIISALFQSSIQIADCLRHADPDAKNGMSNLSGDEQLEVDVATDKIVFQLLKETGACAIACSEETPTEVSLAEGGMYSVGFDPLDGSSVIGMNFAVGSIFGIWKGKGLMNRYGREQISSMIAVHGPRLAIAIAFTAELTKAAPRTVLLTYMGERMWAISKPEMKIAAQGKTFAPGNLRATCDSAAYSSLIAHYITSGYTLRYSGALVPDVFHILAKGSGVYTTVASTKARCKLRLVYEVAPVGLLVECAGGETCTAPSCTDAVEMAVPSSVLDVQITDLDQRLGCCFGGVDDIQLYKQHIYPGK